MSTSVAMAIAAALSAVAASGPVSSAPPAGCAAQMDAYCNGPRLAACRAIIARDGGNTTLVALLDGSPNSRTPAWRCYSPSALSGGAWDPRGPHASLLCTTPQLAAVLDECQHPERRPELVLLSEEAEAQGAVCLDGSPAAMYVRRGAERHRFHIHFEGGGWCFHDPPGLPEDVGCAYRAYSPVPIESSTPPRYLGSSAMLAANYSDGPPRGLSGGFFSPVAADNPLLHNYTLVFLHYCDGASFSGDAAAAAQSPEGPVYYRGKRILDAMLGRLFAAGMAGGATDIVVSGSSAGGLAVYLHLDAVAAAARDRAPGATVRGLASAGYFLELPQPSYAAQMRTLVAEQNVSAGLGAGCLAAAAAASRPPSDCFFADHAALAVQTPLFALQARWDAWQLQHVAHASAKNATAMRAFGAAMDSRIAPLVATAGAPGRNAVFLSPCLTHGIGQTALWTGSRVNGTTPSAAFAAWHAGAGTPHAWIGGVLGDGCP